MKSVMQLIEIFYLNKMIFIYEFESCGIKSKFYDFEKVETDKRKKLIETTKIISVSYDYVQVYTFDDNWCLKFYAHLENGQSFEIYVES